VSDDEVDLDGFSWLIWPAGTNKQIGLCFDGEDDPSVIFSLPVRQALTLSAALGAAFEARAERDAALARAEKAEAERHQWRGSALHSEAAVKTLWHMIPVVEAAKAWRESERNSYWMLDPGLAATQKTARAALVAAVDALNRDKSPGVDVER